MAHLGTTNDPSPARTVARQRRARRLGGVARSDTVGLVALRREVDGALPVAVDGRGGRGVGRIGAAHGERREARAAAGLAGL